MLKDVGQYSAFITGETSEMIPLNVGKSILIDDDDESSIFVEMAELSGRRSLADMNEKAEVPQKITAYVPTTPETMAATLIMLFLFYVLWAAVGWYDSNTICTKNVPTTTRTKRWRSTICKYC